MQERERLGFNVQYLMTNNMKAIVLLSGGLDSSLALKMIADQGIETVALHFVSSFCRCDGSKGCGSSARKISDFVGVGLKIIHLKEEYLDIIKNPKHGYGKNLNPCIDCRILKFTRAREIMEDEGASFVVTGEVLGQRPMSQHRRAMSLIEKESGLTDLIVRPLCAKVMEPALPEREGWVEREKFLDLTGRNRTPQIKLAKDFGIKDYPCPAGGCLLTDPLFAKRLRDLMTRGVFDLANVELLKVGRHFRISPFFKVIVGRNEKENEQLSALKEESDIIFYPEEEVAGPTAIGRGQGTEEDVLLAAGIMARYTDAESEEVKVQIETGADSKTVTVQKKDDAFLDEIRI